MSWVSPTLLLPLLLGAQAYLGLQEVKLKKDKMGALDPDPKMIEKVCGQPEDSGRITGGEDSSITRWPWQASLHYKNHHICGGSLIHSDWVMTAAHCLQNKRKIRHWKIFLGSSVLLPRLFPFFRPKRYSVKKIIIHPYFYGTPPKDIALAKLRSPVRFKETIQPICIPPSRTFFENVTMCWVTGWGKTKEGTTQRKSWYLQAVELPLIDQKTCDLYYHIGTNLSPSISRIYDDMTCAGFVQGKKDACQGDSGGPLTCKVKGIWHQAGIVSWGDGCGRPYRPSVFTNVSVHTDWILSIINSSTFSLMPSKLLFLLTLQLPIHYSVEKFIVHPHFYGTPPKDIALAKLRSPVRFKETIQPICIPPSRTFFENEAQVPLIDQKTCNNYFHKAQPNIKFPMIFDDMTCAGFSDGKKDTCQGDSGGPLVCKVNEIWYQAGIASWGIGCGRNNLPGVYTNVSIYTSWIQQVIQSKNSTQLPTDVLSLLLFLLLLLLHPLLLH
uniref:Testisin-like n=1 Tax=Phascolarctos cinereus TaxID=38626 RepID=A0A6P5L0B9_PHACI|nr:testisin-like [Phascolarctos cinereus]